MRISKTSRSTPKAKVAKKPARSASQKPRAAKSAATAQLNHTPAPSQLSGLKLALSRLADGISNLQAAPLSGQTAQEALAGLRKG
jgi:hypothetical protein